MDKVVILGGDGMFGQHISSHIKGSVTVSRQKCDVTHPAMIDLAIAGADLVINCAAFTDVDLCEAIPGEAFRANALAPFLIGRACDQACIPFMQISTDMVFGRQPPPEGGHYAGVLRDQTRQAVNVYGESKALAEEILLSGGLADWVIRTASLYGVGGRNWPSKLVTQLQKGEIVRADADRVVQPTWAGTAARTIWYLTGLVTQAGPHVRHVVAPDDCTWYDWAVELCRLAGFSRDLVVPVRTADLRHRARRAEDTRLGDSDIKLTWRSMLEDYLTARLGLVPKLEKTYDR